MERREIRSQIQFLPQWSSSSLWLSDRFAGDKLRDVVSELIARLAFVDTNWNAEVVSPIFRTKVEFEISRIKRIEKIAGAAAEVGRWLPKFAEANHKVRAVIEKTPATWASNVSGIRDQLTHLFHESLAYYTPWCFVREIPRYLQAVAFRLDRLKSTGPAKDLQIEATVTKYWKEYHSRLTAMQPSPSTIQTTNGHTAIRLEPMGKLLEFRWLIEELRVSLYAQQLGTRVSVSPKRLDKLLEQIG
jgi:ATP-dependent helicase HrpA